VELNIFNDEIITNKTNKGIIMWICSKFINIIIYSYILISKFLLEKRLTSNIRQEVSIAGGSGLSVQEKENITNYQEVKKTKKMYLMLLVKYIEYFKTYHKYR